ncbi:MAG TPA: hypothetical protein VNX46_00980 [Candidatus Acidoferrum sp.]|nr:hypothetical protein [Candidatus Acidoferrum sp.]
MVPIIGRDKEKYLHWVSTGEQGSYKPATIAVVRHSPGILPVAA